MTPLWLTQRSVDWKLDGRGLVSVSSWRSSCLVRNRSPIPTEGLPSSTPRRMPSVSGTSVLSRTSFLPRKPKKQDGRCNIPDGRGGLKRCPCRIPNPEYVPGRDKSKTIPVKCEGCVFEHFRQEHTTITLSCLDHEGEDGEMEAYEVPAPRSNYAADQYEKLSEEFVAFVRERKPRLAPLAEKLVQEYTKSDAGRELGLPTSTVTSRADKLKELLEEFLDNAIIF